MAFISSLLSVIQPNPHATSIVDEDVVRKTGLMYGIILIGISFLSLLAIIAFMQGGVLLATLDFLVAFILFVILCLLRLKGYLTFCIYTGISIMFCLYLYLFISGGIAGTAFLWSYTFPLFTCFLLGTKKGFIVSLSYFLACLAVVIVDLNSSMINLYSKDLILRFIPSFLTVILFSLVYEKFRESSQRALIEARNSLEKKVVERTEELRYSEARYRTLYDNAGDGISILDTVGRYMSANKQFCEQLGYSEEEIKTKTGADIYKNSSEFTADVLLQRVVSEGSAQFEATQVTRSGDLLPVEVRAHRIVLDDEIAILCSCRDISERQRQDVEKKNLQQQLFRASKMEAIGLMAGGIAHDLNNILTGITGYPELLLLQLPEESDLRKPLLAIKESGERAAAVVADLLTVARGVASVKEVSSVNTFVMEYLGSPEFNHLCSEHPHVQFNQLLSDDLPDISCSSLHIKKCIMNLMLNAAEAIEKSGKITIATSTVDVDLQWATEHGLEPRKYVVVTVEDTGPGISTERIEHIFEPFYTKKVMGRSGTGLGLTVVWNTVQDHGGRIIVNSSDEGTSFQLYFPTSNEKRALLKETEKAEKLYGGGEHVLVVDDEPQLRDIASQMLRVLGYKVDAVCSGELAIEFVREKPVDLIVLDMLMEPGMNGYQTYKEILALYPGQKAVIASGFSESEEVKAALEIGAGGFINKPYSMDQLGRAVKEELSG